MDTPILLLIFNRPDTTQIVFNEIRKQKPLRLFVAADGPRRHKKGESEKCELTRDIIKQIDWDCELKTLYRDENWGCGIAVSSAITWFFDNVEEGIILEDDCVPDACFFEYCETLLAKYRNDDKVMHIGGNNFQNGIKRGEGYYYFSNYSHIWGWATWRRAWKLYDYDMLAYPEFKKQNGIASLFKHRVQQRRMTKIMSRAYQKAYNTWDYQWEFCIWNNNGISIIPNTNLVSNIGFNAEGTHTTSTSHNKGANIPTGSMKFPLAHPSRMEANKDADYYMYKHFVYQSFLKKVKITLQKWLSK